jgi:outer membrane protein assembly factor BamD
MQKRALVLLTLLLVSGCAWFSDDKLEKPAPILIQDGVDAYDRGLYEQAIKNFEQLKDWYPFSKYAILAELKIADSYYHLKRFPEAIQAYEEFEQLHPRNEAIPYIIYQIGMSYYDQIDTVDRDQTSAQKALETFQRLTTQYPDDLYSREARSHIQICYNSLAGHDFYVGMFYFKDERYAAARQRFLSVITKYPDTGIHYRALLFLARCDALILGQKNEALQ